MREYLSGQIYHFQVTDIREVNERKYIYLSDGYRNTYRVLPFDYQLEWEPYHLPPYINCYVESVNNQGLPTLTQVRKEVLAHNYSEQDSEYAFKLVAIKTDENSGAKYYLLHDMFGLTHRYYPRDFEPSREISDIFSLKFKAIEERGGNKANLILAPIERVEPVALLDSDPRQESDFGPENEFVEYKSTLVFPAGATDPDIDKQMIIICKTLAGFMNQEGGELFIGINDSRMVCGIEHDFQYLNSSSSDHYTYSENVDGYENKIRSNVIKLLGNTANANIKISFHLKDKRTYCRIEIKKVQKPVFLNQTKLFQRAGNMTQLLKGDEIIWFIEERFRMRTAPNGHKIEKNVIENLNEVEEHLEVIPPEILIEKSTTIKLKKNEKIWYWMNFYKSGEWSFDNVISKNSEVVYAIAIPDALKKHRLVMAYKNGCVNVVIPYDHIMPKGKNGRKLRKKGERYKNGWNTNAEILNFICADGKDLLAFESIKDNGDQFIKIHNVGAISVHGSMHLEGNVLINSKLQAKIQSIELVSIDHYHLISALVLKDHQTSGYLGYKKSDRSFEKVFSVLDKIKTTDKKDVEL